MNTPSHIIANLALLGRPAAPQANWPIAIGAILPDLPIFLFYAWARSVAQLPENQIWSETYFEPGWQVVFALSHSIPLALLGRAIAYAFQHSISMALFGSMVLHDLADLPVHHDDAHRHFYPLSDYRFMSPVSYWDRDHYGAIIALLELILVAIATIILIQRRRSCWGSGLLLATNAFYAVGYVGLYVLYGR
jgi:hypothetical protein